MGATRGGLPGTKTGSVGNLPTQAVSCSPKGGRGLLRVSLLYKGKETWFCYVLTISIASVISFGTQILSLRYPFQNSESVNGDGT